MARTMTIDLGDELRTYVESLVASGDFKTQSEVIRESLRLLREKEAASKLQELRRLIKEGELSGEANAWDVENFLLKAKALAHGAK